MYSVLSGPSEILFPLVTNPRRAQNARNPNKQTQLLLSTLRLHLNVETTKRK